MDVGATNGWKMEHVVPSRELVERINAELPIEPAEPNYEGEVAERWRYRDGSGEIGFISSVTHAFCSTCTRARLHLLPYAAAQWLLRQRDRRAHRAGLGRPRRPLLRDPHRRDGEAAQSGDVVHRRLNAPPL